MIVIKNLTQLIRFQDSQAASSFFEVLVATVSHEMLTPLNSILTFLNVIIQKIKDSSSLKLLRIIRSSSTSLHYLVSDMMDLFSIKNGQFKKNERVVDVGLELHELIEILREPCSQKGLHLDFQVSHELPAELLVDIHRVKQVLMNLIQNAIKFTIAGRIRV
jgi:signal transduction histidine kinase